MASNESYSVAGKTAIITGAGSGINFEFAVLLLSEKCNVVIADLVLRPESEALLKKYSNKDSSPRAVFVKTDVTKWSELERMFQTTLDEFGSFDIVCPGAGIYEPHWTNFWHPPGSPASRDKPNSDGYALLDINLTHPIRVTQMAISEWLHPRSSSELQTIEKLKSNPKRIVHISSIAGQVPSFNAPIYVVTKFGISGLVRSIAHLEEAVGVRVNAVAPGVVRTPLWTEHPEKLRLLKTSQDGWVTPEEVAKAMLRLVTDPKLGGGTIFEVGKDCTRLVQAFNDPGPATDPALGLIASNADQGKADIQGWLLDGKIWGSRSKL
ncbi:hypothetical protein F5Y16DRAFT_361961 [Xylariaceae sp. FL0255]|nr:hypothetical protein F5Y16DRAFT_361961 [Xylariaceae sp. FL0255]